MAIVVAVGVGERVGPEHAAVSANTAAKNAKAGAGIRTD